MSFCPINDGFSRLEAEISVASGIPNVLNALKIFKHSSKSAKTAAMPRFPGAAAHIPRPPLWTSTARPPASRMGAPKPLIPHGRTPAPRVARNPLCMEAAYIPHTPRAPSQESAKEPGHPPQDASKE